MTHRYNYLLFLLLPGTHLPGVVVVIRFLNGPLYSTHALDLLRKLAYLLLSRLNKLLREVICVSLSYQTYPCTFYSTEL